MQQQKQHRLIPSGLLVLSVLFLLSCSHCTFLTPESATAAREQRLRPSNGRRASATAALLSAMTLAAEQPTGAEEIRWKALRPIQYIAALGDPEATSGTGAQSWGLWKLDPGPRGVDLDNIAKVESQGGVAPAGWKFDGSDWYVEEHGLIMEKPTGGDGGSGETLKPGKYLVTGARKVRTALTVFPPDATGNQRWELAEGKLFDVTHLPCRTGRYTGAGCTPAKARKSDFPVTPGALMPAVEGCNKQDYAVLFVLGVA